MRKSCSCIGYSATFHQRQKQPAVIYQLSVLDRDFEHSSVFSSIGYPYGVEPYRR